MELKKFVKSQRGIFFSADALIALTLILFVILIVYPVDNYVQPDSDIHTDMLNALSTLKVVEAAPHNSYVNDLIASGKIKDVEKSLLEQIGEFYVLEYPNITEAQLFAESVLSDLNTTENIGIWFGTPPNDFLVFSRNQTPYNNARKVDVARQVIAGIEAGNATKGFSARAYLSSDSRTIYFYFGGYVGDGNISVKVDYAGNISNEAEIELVVIDSDNDFDLYVNNVSIGVFPDSPDAATPVNYTFSTSNFHNGTNIVELKGEHLYIAGGFLKVTYQGEVQLNGQDGKYYFPGIDGLINLYDGFFVPNNLTAMNISLHVNSNYTFFLNIGNVTVYRGTTNGEENITLDNIFLDSLLDYSSMEGKTVPLRLGLENASFLGITQLIDVFSVTDLSGSMDDNCGSCSEVTCSQVSCGDADGCKVCDAKNAGDILIDIILNNTGNRMGLAGYETTARDSDFHALSNDSVSLKTEISSWDADGYTCICCGINKATRGFFPEGFKDRLVAYYDFNGGTSGALSDISGAGNNGTIVGTATSVSGVSGNAFSFLGSGSNYISMPDILDMEQGSVSFWFDPDRDDSNTIFDASTSNKYFYIDIDNGEDLRFFLEDYNDADFQDSEQDVRNIHTSGWHHVVAVWKYNGASFSTQLYLDGNLIDSDNDPAGSMPDFLAPRIGESRSGGSSWDYEGDIDEFRIYSKALNLTEVRGLDDATPICGNDITEVGEVCDGDSQWCEAAGNEGLKQCNALCNGFLACDTVGTCGDFVRNSEEDCDDGNLFNGDGCSENCTVENRFKSIVVMSDGLANRGCSEQGTGDSVNDAIQASVDACQEHGIVVYAVAFGSDADNQTMINIADNGCGGGFYYSDASDLADVYRQIAYSIITTYVEQTLNATGEIYTKLYPDSYIDFAYDKLKIPYGLIITLEKLFDNENGGSFLVPAGVEPVITHIISYSGPKWTTTAKVNNDTIFNLSSYAQDFVQIGDPYQVTLADSIIVPGSTNIVNVTTGISPQNQSAGSSYNKIIYTIAKNASTFTDIYSFAGGCDWHIQFEDGSISDIPIPDTYLGGQHCYYNETDGKVAFEQDAFQVAALELLRELDIDNDGKVDIALISQDLKITLSEISGIPFSYYTEVQVRRWS